MLYKSISASIFDISSYILYLQILYAVVNSIIILPFINIYITFLFKAFLKSYS